MAALPDGPDDDLLRLVSRTFAARDPLPAALSEQARAAATWRTVDAELAELTGDSLLAAAAGTRGPGDERTLTFEAPRLRVELVVDGDALVVQLVPPAEADIELRAGDERRSARTSALGQCVIGDAPRGRISLRILPAGSDVAIETSVVTI